MGAQARGDAVEVRIVVTGMADQLPDAFGHVVKQMLEAGCVEIAGGGDAQGAVWRGQGIKLGEEGIVQALQCAELQLADEAAADGDAPRGFEGIAQCRDATGMGCTGERPHDGREEVRVLVRVKVGDADACGLQLAHLRGGFALNLKFVEAAQHQIAHEDAERGAEVNAVFAEERRNLGGREDGETIRQNDVAADAEERAGKGERDGIVKRRACGHERGGAEAAGIVQFCDGAIDAGGEAEIVSIDEKAGHLEQSINAVWNARVMERRRRDCKYGGWPIDWKQAAIWAASSVG